MIVTTWTKKACDLKSDIKQKLILLALLLFLTVLLVILFLYQYLGNIYFSYGESNIEQNFCPHGYFKLGTMKNCSPWLSCQAIKREVRKLKHVGGGAVKRVCLTSWISNIIKYYSIHSQVTIYSQ